MGLEGHVFPEKNIKKKKEAREHSDVFYRKTNIQTSEISWCVDWKQRSFVRESWGAGLGEPSWAVRG